MSDDRRFGSLIERLRSTTSGRLEARHGVSTTILALLAGLLCGSYGAWVTADFGVRWPAFFVVGTVCTLHCVRQDSPITVVTTGLYLLAAGVAMTPLFLAAGGLVGASAQGVGNPWQTILSAALLVAVVLFGVLSAIIASIGVVLERLFAPDDD